MGADSRATGGNIILDKHSKKVHHLTSSMFACGAGTAADLDQVRNHDLSIFSTRISGYENVECELASTGVEHWS